MKAYDNQTNEETLKKVKEFIELNRKFPNISSEDPYEVWLKRSYARIKTRFEKYRRRPDIVETKGFSKILEMIDEIETERERLRTTMSDETIEELNRDLDGILNWCKTNGILPAIQSNSASHEQGEEAQLGYKLYRIICLIDSLTEEKINNNGINLKKIIERYREIRATYYSVYGLEFIKRVNDLRDWYKKEDRIPDTTLKYEAYYTKNREELRNAETWKKLQKKYKRRNISEFFIRSDVEAFKSYRYIELRERVKSAYSVDEVLRNKYLEEIKTLAELYKISYEEILSSVPKKRTNNDSHDDQEQK